MPDALFMRPAISIIVALSKRVRIPVSFWVAVLELPARGASRNLFCVLFVGEEILNGRSYAV